MAESQFVTEPIGKLGIIACRGCEEMASNINYYLVKARNEREANGIFDGYHKESYVIDCEFVRFSTGEGKCVIHESVRGYDLFVLCDPFNYGVSYKMYGLEQRMSPDDHFADLKRALSAIEGKAKRITVLMPMLYEGRQHKRTRRESLDCADMLRELCFEYGVDDIVTFDAHDPRVQNAIPEIGFESVQPSYQFIKALLRNVSDIKIDPEHLMIVSPDEGGMNRCIYLATVLGIELGAFYKLRDYSRVVDGSNPILRHEFLGEKIDGKDIIVMDDMISSGSSMIEVCEKLKEIGANRIYIYSSFGLFCNGFDKFDKAYEKGLFDKVFTTNLVYTPKALLDKPWYVKVDMSKYCSFIIDKLNHDESLSDLLDPSDRIYGKLAEYGQPINNNK